MAEGRAVCKRCGFFKWQKSRGLCETCWKVARQTNFEHYPIRSEMPKAEVCQCRSPIPEPLPVWDAVQCKRCGKKVMK